MKINRSATTDREVMDAAVRRAIDSRGRYDSDIAMAAGDLVRAVMRELDAVIDWEEEPMTDWGGWTTGTTLVDIDGATTNGPCPTTPSYGRPGQGL
jgi:hypothetical protein